MLPESLFRFLNSLDNFLDGKKPFQKYEELGMKLEEKEVQLDKDWSTFGAEMEKAMNKLQNKIE